MDVWKIKKWQSIYKQSPKRSGLRIRYDKGVDPEVKRAIGEFAVWLRSEYVFPMRVPIYVKPTVKIKAMDGEMVYGTCFLPFDRQVEPYIRIATGDYCGKLNGSERDNILGGILETIVHELTHYFQWVNGMELSVIGEERQATNYASRIVDKYAETKEHP